MASGNDKKPGVALLGSKTPIVVKKPTEQICISDQTYATSEPVTNGASTADKEDEGAMETDEATKAPYEAKTSEPQSQPTADDKQVCSL